MFDCDNLSWNDIYKIGDNEIDKEHRNIFEIADKLSIYKDSNEKIQQLLQELLSYTQVHFKNEEEYMAQLEYPLLKEHKRYHAQLIKDLKTFLEEISSLEYQAIADKLKYFIKTRILMHILIEDKKLQHFKQDKTKLKESFQWKSLYNIGNATIDAEHKKLFSIANKALNYSYYQNMQKNLKLTLKQLYEYMKTHFAHEEKYMKNINYPNLAQHQEIHAKIIESLNTFIKELPTLTTQQFQMKLLEAIDIRFVNHIIVEDSKIACFVKKKKFLT